MTTEEAFERLAVHKDGVHTFVQAGGVLIGADWTLDQVREAIDRWGVEESGPDATAMGHGLVIEEKEPRYRPVFLATKETE